MSSHSHTQRPGKIGNWIVFILAGLICAGVGGYFGIRWVYRTQALSPFQASLPDYLAARPSGEPTEQPCKSGIIAIDSTASEFDNFYFDLPVELKAADPAAVKTIVFLRWDRKQTHTYGNNKPGYTNSCHVEVVDRDTKKFLKQAQFVGPPPPTTISGRASSGESARPTDQMIVFLKSNMAP